MCDFRWATFSQDYTHLISATWTCAHPCRTRVRKKYAALCVSGPTKHANQCVTIWAFLVQVVVCQCIMWIIVSPVCVPIKYCNCRLQKTINWLCALQNPTYMAYVGIIIMFARVHYELQRKFLDTLLLGYTVYTIARNYAYKHII